VHSIKKHPQNAENGCVNAAEGYNQTSQNIVTQKHAKKCAALKILKIMAAEVFVKLLS